MKNVHGGDDLEDDFVPDELVALSGDEDVFVDDERHTPKEYEEGTSSCVSNTNLVSKKRKRREKEKERKVCLSVLYV